MYRDIYREFLRKECYNKDSNQISVDIFNPNNEIIISGQKKNNSCYTGVWKRYYTKDSYAPWWDKKKSDISQNVGECNTYIYEDFEQEIFEDDFIKYKKTRSYFDMKKSEDYYNFKIK